jgi:hypothetical protein
VVRLLYFLVAALRKEQVAEADPTKKLGADMIGNPIDYFRAVLRRVNVHAERSLAKGGIDQRFGNELVDRIIAYVKS